MNRPVLIGVAAVAACFATLAFADRAAPRGRTAVCAAARPHPGAAFSGPVLQVIDGRTLCVALGPDSKDWVLVRVDGASSARGALMAAVFAQRLDCVAGADSDQGVNATCRMEGVPLALLLQRSDVHAQALAWR
jgi:hypothetical protein